MDLQALEAKIARTDISAEERLAALRELKQVAPSPVQGIFVNNHIHTCYSFSPYTPTSAVYFAWKAGLRTAGIMDHDSISGAREFLEAGAIMGMPVTCGVECRVNVKGTALEGKRINNPDQLSCAYLAMHGIPHRNIDTVAEILADVREKRNVRNRKMCVRITEITGMTLDFDVDVYPLSMGREGGSVTERHILYALTKKITARYPDRKEACDLIEQLTEAPLGEKTREKLLAAPDHFYEYDILGVLKGHLVKRFYIDADEECMNIREFTALAKRVGAISAYAYLGDVGESPTGDKKAQKFEDDYLPLLFEVLRDCEFSAVTYMPSRNTSEQLARLIGMCHENGFFEISGEDINSPRQSFLCEALNDPKYAHLMTATYALIGHERAAGENTDRAMFSEATKASYPDLNTRIQVYAALGGLNSFD